MAGSINQVLIVGRLGKDPEIRRTQSGKAIANLRVATSETWRDKASGERREKTEWHSVVIFSDGLVGIAEKYLRKGSNVLLQGSLSTRKWQTQDGQDRYSTEVVLQGYDAKLVLLDGKERSDNGDSRSDHAPANGGSAPAYEPGAYEESIPF